MKVPGPQGNQKPFAEHTIQLLRKTIERLFVKEGSLSLSERLFVPDENRLPSGFFHAVRLLAKHLPNQEEFKQASQPRPQHEVRAALQLLAALIGEEKFKTTLGDDRLRALVQELIRVVGHKEMGTSDHKSPPFSYLAQVAERGEGLKKQIPFPFSKEKEKSPEKLTHRYKRFKKKKGKGDRDDESPEPERETD